MYTQRDMDEARGKLNDQWRSTGVAALEQQRERGEVAFQEGARYIVQRGRAAIEEAKESAVRDTNTELLHE
mgnify:CR=1 FL=1